MDTNEYITGLLEGIAEIIGRPDNMSLPDPSMVTMYQHLGERKIWIDLTVDENLLEYAKYITVWNEEDRGKPTNDRKPIWIYIFCYGGNPDIMWAFTDIVAASETPVYTVNIGKCCSAAALIFMSGHKRFMLPSATVLIHEGWGEISGDAVKVFDQADSYKLMVKKMHNFILSHSNIPSGTLSKKKNNDWELDSDSCIKYGVCDSVVQNLSEIL